MIAKQTRLEEILENVPIYRQLGMIRHEMKVTASSEVRYHGPTNILGKLDWFLQILCGEMFLQQKGWGKIRPIITLRNSFIHPKPTDADKYQKQVDSISKESLLEFMEACTDCYNFLNDIKSSEFEEYNEKINGLTALVDQEYKMNTMKWRDLNLSYDSTCKATERKYILNREKGQEI
ncbi:hypothetical protein [Bacillus thuringiensis]|uniref:hypothetical protein n=2 Tax=Bacillus cereus group TaxID=86661 RepID=UPI000A987DD3